MGVCFFNISVMRSDEEPDFAHSTGMLRIRKIGSILICSLLLMWYSLPSVQTLLCGPSVLNRATSSAPLLTLGDGVVPVRESRDQRLSSVSEPTYAVKLFGVIPVRTLHGAGTQRDVAPSGKIIGIVLHTEGVQIVGLGGIQTGHGTQNPASDAGLQAGDTVLSVNGTPIESSAQFIALCSTDQTIELQCLRNGNLRTVTVTPVLDADGAYRIGAWVRDSTSGLGTMSFVDPQTNRFAALGHGVSDVDTGVLLRYGNGLVYSAAVTGVQRASGGKAGELIGSFTAETDLAVGALQQNTPYGIAGTLYRAFSHDTVPIAQEGEVRTGEAQIQSTVHGQTVRTYAARVIRLDVQASSETNGFMIQITDPSLIQTTGGIVQGMSGSPVLQDGKLIGVVTHVFLGDSTRGYCIYAGQMYEKLMSG